MSKTLIGIPSVDAIIADVTQLSTVLYDAHIERFITNKPTKELLESVDPKFRYWVGIYLDQDPMEVSATAMVLTLFVLNANQK